MDSNYSHSPGKIDLNGFFNPSSHLTFSNSHASFLRFSIYLKRKPTLKKTHTPCPMQSESGTCRLCGLMTAQISVLALWVLSLGVKRGSYTRITIFSVLRCRNFCPPLSISWCSTSFIWLVLNVRTKKSWIPKCNVVLWQNLNGAT